MRKTINYFNQHPHQKLAKYLCELVSVSEHYQDEYADQIRAAAKKLVEEGKETARYTGSCGRHTCWSWEGKNISLPYVPYE